MRRSGYGLLLPAWAVSSQSKLTHGETRSAKCKEVDLLERLHSAAYAGRIKFRALKNGEYPADGHKDIDALYFRQQRGFEWDCDRIWSRDPNRTIPRKIGTTFISTGNNLSRCYKNGAFRFNKISTPRSQENEKHTELVRRGDPLPYTSFWR